ncbi:hypothetical protein THRCLA_21442, partial [Thraustotheca clavata]
LADTEPLTIERVLLWTFIVVIFVSLLEEGLHQLHHICKKYPKYDEMLQKITGELMVVGLIYLLVKLICYFNFIKYGGVQYYSLDAADMLLFFVALALVIQSIIVFVRLRFSNKKIDDIMITETGSLIQMAEAENEKTKKLNWFSKLFSKYQIRAKLEHKLLEIFFRSEHHLPTMFTFAKYIREVQDSQIVDLVEIDIIGYGLLLLLLAAFFASTGELQVDGLYRSSYDNTSSLYQLSATMDDERKWIFKFYAWSLTVAMTLMALYLRILNHAVVKRAIDRFRGPLSEKLDSYDDELIDATKCAHTQELLDGVHSAEEAMNLLRIESEKIREKHNAREDQRRGWFKKNLAVQLLHSAYRKITRKSDKVESTDSLNTENTLKTMKMPLPFSRKFVEFCVRTFLIVNGLYYSMLVVCVVPTLSTSELPILALLVLPLLINTLWLSPLLVHKFSLLNGTWKVDPKKLCAVIDHIREVEELNVNMVKQIQKSILNELEDKLKAPQVSGTNSESNKIECTTLKTIRNKMNDKSNGTNEYAEVEDIRQILTEHGFKFSSHKFHTLVYLKYQTKGTKVLYNDIVEALIPRPGSLLASHPSFQFISEKFQGIHRFYFLITASYMGSKPMKFIDNGHMSNDKMSFSPYILYIIHHFALMTGFQIQLDNGIYFRWAHQNQAKSISLFEESAKPVGSRAIVKMILLSLFNWHQNIKMVFRELYEKAEPLTIGWVLYCTVFVIIFVILLEAGLHKLIHVCKRHHKYHEMIHKVTGELMVVGLIYLLVKMLCYFKVIQYGGVVYYAMDAADILLLFVAIALVFQALILFARLRSTNAKMDSITIMSAADLILMAKEDENTNSGNLLCSQRRKLLVLMEHKVVEAFFHELYGLPKIFSFSKYLREIQDGQIVDLIEVDFFGWILLLILTSAFFAFTGELQANSVYRASYTNDLYHVSAQMLERRELVFSVFAVSLTIAMILMAIYLRVLNKAVMQKAKKYFLRSQKSNLYDQTHEQQLITALESVSEIEHEQGKLSTKDAIDKMTEVSNKLSNEVLGHHGFFQGSIIVQLFRSCFCNIKRKFTGETKTSSFTNDFHQAMPLPFSRKAVQFLVQFFLIVNGLYYGMLLAIVVPSLDEDELPILATLFIPLVLNTFWLAPLLVHKFSLLDGTWRVVPKKLAAVIDHLKEVEELNGVMFEQIGSYLQSHMKFVKDIENELNRIDKNDGNQDGHIDIERLRQVFINYGFKLSRHKFTTLVLLKYQTKGTTVNFMEILNAIEKYTADSTTPLTIERVLLWTFCVVLFVSLLEAGLHKLIHICKHHRKYYEMLHKVTGELMIVGLIYLLVKLVCYFNVIQYGGVQYYSLDAADMLLFFVALALVFQSIISFVRLRRANAKMDSLTITTAGALVDITKAEYARLENAGWWKKSRVINRMRSLLEHKLLEAFFHEVYGLPMMFSFSKYLREVQDSHIVDLIEIDILGWTLLLALLAGFFAATGELQTHSLYRTTFNATTSSDHTTIALDDKRKWVFGLFASSLTLVMVMTAIYLKILNNAVIDHALHHFLVGNDEKIIDKKTSYDKHLMEALKNVEIIAKERAEISPTEAMEQMRNVSENIRVTLRKRKGYFKNNLMVQLAQSSFRKIMKKSDKNLPLNHVNPMLKMPLPFSRKFVQFCVRTFMIVNGLYYSMLIACIVPTLSDHQLPHLFALMIPLLLNTFWLAQ